MHTAKVALLIVVLGCKGRSLLVDPPPPPPPPPGLGPLPYADIDPDSVVMSPSETVRLRVLSVNGATPDRVVWRTSDTTVSTIDSLGLLTARAIGLAAVEAQASRGTTIAYARASVRVR